MFLSNSDGRERVERRRDYDRSADYSDRGERVDRADRDRDRGDRFSRRSRSPERDRFRAAPVRYINICICC